MIIKNTMQLAFMKTISFMLMCLPLTMVMGQNSHQPSLKVGPKQPNILWIYVEDTNDWMSCYGDTVVKTPNIDQLASDGIRFDRAYMTAGVCSPTRSANITSMYQTSIGAHEHYSSFSEWRGNKMEHWEPNHLGVKTIPEIFQAAGYYTFNDGKFHYNFVYDEDDLYDHVHAPMGFHVGKEGTAWAECPVDQPFFGQIQLKGGKNLGNSRKIIQADEVEVHPYYPDHPVFRQMIADHYNTILELDRTTGEIIEALKRDGHYENTVIFFFSDHGCALPRHKQFIYDEGIRVPFILAGPGIESGKVRNDLVSGIDLGATSLALAGIGVPGNMQGRNMLSPDFHRDYVVSARDRCDFTIDRIRAVTTQRFKYIHNFMTDKPYLQPNYRSGSASMKLLAQMHREGTLNAVQDHFASEVRPAEEFYDLENDPHETKNLIHSADRKIAIEIGKHRDILYRWILETNDKGRFPETDNALRAVVDRWGSKAVNREYDRVRE